MEVYNYLVNSGCYDIFDSIYAKNLEIFASNYKQANLLTQGNRYRAKLVIWGYLFSGEEEFDKNCSYICDVASAIEFIHKASLIIDDIIDNDSMRYGKPAFHCQFSVNEAIVFSINMLGYAIKLINEAIGNLRVDYPHILQINTRLSDIIVSMSTGALQEMNMKNLSYDEMKQLIILQTSKIISNALVIGYLSGKSINDEVVEILDKIGEKCGFIYQIFNDLEPIFNAEFNKIHKGKVNYDLEKNRKNIISIFDKNEADAMPLEVKKQRIFKIVREEVEEIYLLIDKLPAFCESEVWIKNFSMFFSNILAWGAKRASLGNAISSVSYCKYPTVMEPSDREGQSKVLNRG